MVAAAPRRLPRRQYRPSRMAGAHWLTAMKDRSPISTSSLVAPSDQIRIGSEIDGSSPGTCAAVIAVAADCRNAVRPTALLLSTAGSE